MKQRPVFRIFFAALLAACLTFPWNAMAATLTDRSIVMERNQPGVSSNQEIRFTTPSGVDAAGETVVLNYAYDFDLSTIGVGDIDLFYGPTTGFETEATLAASAGVNIWGVTISGRTITFAAPTNTGPVSAGDLMIIRIGTNASGGTSRIVNPDNDGEGTAYVTIDGTFGDTGGFDVPIYQNDFINISATVIDATPVPPPGPGPGGGGPGVDGTAPSLSSIRVINITTSTVTVIWNTDEPATGTVEYGLTPTYGSSASHTGLSTSHSVNLTGLDPDTEYNFRVISSDAVGNTAQSGNLTFRTLPPPTPPVISNILVINITDSSAVVTWDTDIPSSSFVEFGETVAYGRSASSPGLVTDHSVLLTGLDPSTLYHFRVGSTEASGLTSISGDNTFTTLGDTTPPSNVFNFVATAGNGENLLTWNNPPDPDFAFVHIRARTDGYPVSPSDGRLVYQGAAEGVIDSGLVNGTTYYYTNFAFDSGGNRSSGAFAQATPSETAPPLPPLPPAPPGPTPPGPTPPTPPGVPGATTTPPVPPGATTTPPIPPIVSPTTTEPGVPSGIVINPAYYGAAGTIQLEEDASGRVGSVPGVPVLVRVPTAGLGRAPSSAIIEVNGSRYALTPLPDGESLGASFIPSDRVGEVQATVILSFPDGSQSRATNTIVLQPFGRVLSRSLLSPIPSGLEGASVTLYEMTLQGWMLWDATRHAQSNPQLTGSDGVYGFVVRNGMYRVVVEKEGYVTQDREFRVTRNVASVDVLMPAEIEIPIIGAVLDLVQSEEAQEVATITGPVLLAVALANLAFAASFASLLNYLWFLFTQPFLLLARKRRQRWGLTYNALSKLPIDLVAVRLIHAKTNLILQTRITDEKGRFSFRVRPGAYRLEAARQGYRFPSEYLKGQKEDGELLDIYHGEMITVQEESTIAVNIPLDPLVKEETPRIILIKRALRKFQHALGLTSVIITIAALTILPTWWMAGLLVLQVTVYLLFRRLAMPKKPKGWGIIYDAKSRKPVGATIVRIFDKKFNKLLETQVSDSRGNYGFFAQKNVYFITAEKKGFKKFKSDDVDLTQKDVTVVDKHIKLEGE
jgi:chitodextrinase